MIARIGNKLIASLKPKDKPYQVHDEDLRRFFVRVQPTGVLTYGVSVRLPNRRRTVITIGQNGIFTPAQARDEAKKILADIARGVNPNAKKQDSKIPTFREFIEIKYGPWVLANRKSGAHTLRQLLCPVFKKFHNRFVNEIDPWMVEQWRTKRRNNGSAIETVNRDLGKLKAVLSKAVEWGFLEHHPLTKVKPLRVDSNRRIRFLEMDEEIRLREHLDLREDRLRAQRNSYNQWLLKRKQAPLPDLVKNHFADYLKPMVLVAINTGIRRGEMFNLRWDDIDFRRRFLRINADGTKSSKTRYIALNDEAQGTLRAWKDQSPQKSGLVFVGKNGSRFTNIDRSWENLLKDAQIEDFRWHDLRHHFASKLVMAGVDLNTVRELLGHSDLKMTLRYAHLSPEAKAQAVAKIQWQPAKEPCKEIEKYE